MRSPAQLRTDVSVGFLLFWTPLIFLPCWVWGLFLTASLQEFLAASLRCIKRFPYNRKHVSVSRMCLHNNGSTLVKYCVNQ